MKITLWERTYNTFGSHRTLSLVGQFLSMDSPSFGEGISEIEFNLYFRSSSGPRKTLETSYAQYHRYLSELPKYRFLRKKHRFSVDFESKAATGEEIARQLGLSLGVFSAVCGEVLRHLEILRTRVRPTDNFDVSAFLQWVQERMSHLPASMEELEEIEARAKAFARARLDAMDEWEKLGLDWDDFHPRARELLDKPFFWECCNDFAPNGNDTGADVMGLFREWRKRHKGTSSELFFRQLLKDWEVDADATEADTFSVQTFDESAIGLAFAHLKLDGAWPAWIRDKALAAVSRQKRILERDHRGWQLFERKAESLRLMDEKLRTIPAS